jgi:hypothetical protein
MKTKYQKLQNTTRQKVEEIQMEIHRTESKNERHIHVPPLPYKSKMLERVQLFLKLTFP